MRLHRPFGVTLLALVLLTLSVVVVPTAFSTLASLPPRPNAIDITLYAHLGRRPPDYSAIHTSMMLAIILSILNIIIGIGLFKLKGWSRYLAMGQAGLFTLLLLVNNISSPLTGGQLLIVLCYISAIVYLAQPAVQQAFAQADSVLYEQDEPDVGDGTASDDSGIDDNAEFVPPELLGLTLRRTVL